MCSLPQPSPLRDGDRLPSIGFELLRLEVGLGLPTLRLREKRTRLLRRGVRAQERRADGGCYRERGCSHI